MDVVFYHKSCPDGWCSAYIAKKKYPEVKLVPLDHDLKPEEVDKITKDCVGLDVLMIDYSFRTREQNDALATCAKSFRLLDHHKTAQAILKDAPYATFDMTRSGAGLAWDYLFRENNPEAGFDMGTNFEPRPWWVNYTEDRDLWTWKLNCAKEVCAFMSLFAYTIEEWDVLITSSLSDAIARGHWAQKQIDIYVAKVVDNLQVGSYKGTPIAVSNVPYMFCSEVGNAQAKRYGLSLTWFERKDGNISFSLRGDGSIDVSAIAQKYSGGGHRNAAGFQLPIKEGRRLLDVILGREIEWYSPEAIEIVRRCIK